jgi:hypothetical protein
MQKAHGNRFVQRLLGEVREAISLPKIATGQFVAPPGAVPGQEQVEQRWHEWLGAAKEGTRQGVDLWQRTATLSEVKVEAATAIGGVLRGSPIKPHIVAALAGRAAPGHVIGAFAEAAGRAWDFWTSKVGVPGLPWYPAFAALPVPIAPPTPNVPTPLSAITRGATIDGGSVSRSIIGMLGPEGAEPAARDAANEFGDWLSASFVVWHVTTMVTNVIGRGPVPTFAPPYVPVGPVVHGSAESVPGGLVGPRFGI